MVTRVTSYEHVCGMGLMPTRLINTTMGEQWLSVHMDGVRLEMVNGK